MAGSQAVVELGEEPVEQVPEGSSVPVSMFSAALVVAGYRTTTTNASIAERRTTTRPRNYACVARR